MAESKKVTTKDVVKKATTKNDNIVTVVGTEKSKTMVTGKEYKVSETLANTVIEKGFATLKK